MPPCFAPDDDGGLGTSEEFVAVRLLMDGPDTARVLLDYLYLSDLEMDDESDMSVDDFTDIREMLAAAELADEDAGPAPSAAEALFGGASPFGAEPAPELGPEEPISLAGTVQTVLEGLVVVKAAAGAPTLQMGAWLVLASRAPLGQIHEVFGPVVAPLYALPAPDGAPAELSAGAQVFSVDRLAELVPVEDLRGRKYDPLEDATPDEERDSADPDAQFSDDEAVRCLIDWLWWWGYFSNGECGWQFAGDTAGTKVAA